MYTKYKTNYRDLVMGVNTQIPLSNGKLVTAINFDNAATTPPFTTVVHAINNFAPWYSSIHRGTGYKSQYSSELYENSRELVKSFLKADADQTVIYVKNTSEAINKLAYRFSKRFRDNVVLSTHMEHHSNDLPWRSRYEVDYIAVDRDGRLPDMLEKKTQKSN